MKYFLLLFTFIIINLNAINFHTIYEIQYTNKAIDGTFPSKFVNSELSTKGIVTSLNVYNDIAFVQHKSGAWQGLKLIGNFQTLDVGDFIKVYGTIKEKNGMTVLFCEDFDVIAKNQKVPIPVDVSSFEISRSEEYESVLVKIHNISIINENKRIFAKDMSGECIVGNLLLEKLNLSSSNSYNFLIGVSDFSYGNFSINPRFYKDFGMNTRQVTNTSWGKVKSLYK